MTTENMMPPDPLRHHRRHEHLEAPFGSDSFGKAAEKFARFFGTPKFIVGQTAIVAVWILLNALVLIRHWDAYPFILLNLLFSTQAAYAAPLILLAATRQADRDKATAVADALHREEVATSQAAGLAENTALTNQVHDLVTGDTALTQQVCDLVHVIAGNTAVLDEIHRHVAAITPEAGKFPPGGREEKTLAPALPAASERIRLALELVGSFSQDDGGHHKAWVIDQVVRILTGDGYSAWIANYRADGMYSWNEGIAP